MGITLLKCFFLPGLMSICSFLNDKFVKSVPTKSTSTDCQFREKAFRTLRMGNNNLKILNLQELFTKGLFGLKEVGGSEEVSFPTSAVHPKHRKRKMEKPLFYFTFHFYTIICLTFKVLQFVIM